MRKVVLFAVTLASLVVGSQFAGAGAAQAQEAYAASVTEPGLIHSVQYFRDYRRYERHRYNRFRRHEEFRRRYEGHYRRY